MEEEKKLITSNECRHLKGATVYQLWLEYSGGYEYIEFNSILSENSGTKKGIEKRDQN